MPEHHPSRNGWIGVVSREHVRIGVAGGFIQINHGSKAPLQRLHAGDGLAMYSPPTACPDGEVLQHFTAIGTVVSGEICQVEMTPAFKPYRIEVAFAECREAPIRPLIERLSFIRNRASRGAAFRFGCVKVPAEDFRLISAATRAEAVLGQAQDESWASPRRTGGGRCGRTVRFAGGRRRAGRRRQLRCSHRAIDAPGASPSRRSCAHGQGTRISR